MAHTHAPDKHAVGTGPIHTDITLDDGTVVDCRPDWALVDTEEQRDELLHKIGLYYQEHGHPHHDADTPFTYKQGE